MWADTEVLGSRYPGRQVDALADMPTSSRRTAAKGYKRLKAAAI
jgi:hypothetical protein